MGDVRINHINKCILQYLEMMNAANIFSSINRNHFKREYIRITCTNNINLIQIRVYIIQIISVRYSEMCKTKPGTSVVVYKFSRMNTFHSAVREAVILDKCFAL